MSTTFNLPDLGEGLPDAEIVAWHVSEGQSIVADAPLLSVETAKAVVDVPSPWSGKILKLHGAAGAVIEVGAALVDFQLENSADSSATKSATPPARSASTRDRSDLQGPAQNPASVHEPDPDQGSVVGSMRAGIVELSRHETGARMPSVARQPDEIRVRAAPAVRAVAAKFGIDLTAVPASGSDGVTTLDDVMRVIGPGQTGADAASRTRPSADGVLYTDPFADAEPLRGMRRSMSQSMSLARDQIAACTVFDDADVDRWKSGTDISVRVVRAIAAAATEEPRLNAWVDPAGSRVRLLKDVDIAIAMDTAEGLFVPVLRAAQAKNALELRAELDRLKQAARERSLKPEDMQGHTISLSNFGTLAGRYATPVVVPPAVAILGTGKVRRDVLPALSGDGVEVRRRLPLSLTFDHRAITGGEACRFLAVVIRSLEAVE